MAFFEKLKIFFGFQEDPAQETSQTPSMSAPQPQPKDPQPSVIRGFKASLVNSQNAQPFPASEIKVEEPRIYEDSLNIATYLREHKPVIINLKYLDASSGKRLVDFICGTAYAINGHMMKIGENIFLFTPANVEIVNSTEKSTFEQGVEQDEKDVFFNQAVI